MSKRERATGRGKAWLVPSLLLDLLVHDYLFYYYKSTNTVSLGTTPVQIVRQCQTVANGSEQALWVASGRMHW